MTRMRKIGLGKIGLAFMAVCAVSATSVSSASAQLLFLFHPNSGTFPLLILALAQGPQKFTTAVGTIECNHFTGHGIATELRSLDLLLTVSYTGCTAFGLAAKITTVKYLLTAHGLVSLENTVSITALGCEVKVPSAKNQNLELILILNRGTDILIHSDVNGIASSGTGAACSYAEESKGVYTGLALIFAHGGSIIWHPF